MSAPRLLLRTLTRGDGWLGLRAGAGFGPRSAQVTVALVHDAVDTGALSAAGLMPLPPQALQWRAPELASQLSGAPWSLAEEGQWADFHALRVEGLRASGWQVAVAPGFAHFTAPVQGWRLELTALHQPKRLGSWLLSLGVDVEGETLDLTPLLAELFKREAQWLDADAVAALPDEAPVVLRAPGGRRIETTAAPLKPIVLSMLDVLLQRAPRRGPLVLQPWQAQRAEALRAALADSQAARAGTHGRWQLQGDAGLTQLAARLAAAGSPPPVAPPAALCVTLRSYQSEGLAWLQYLREQHLGGVLADDMGLGKTLQVLAHVLVEQQAGRLDAPALIVLPTSLLGHWTGEAARHAPTLRTLALHGPARKRDFKRIADHDLVFTTYPLLARDLDALKAQPWHLLVLDEAQFAKNAGSRAASAARRLQVRHRLCVTGTPLENHLGELWAHFDWLMPGFLGDARSFTRLWRRPIEDNGEVHRAELLAQRIRPFVLRRSKADVAAELPPLTEVTRRIVLQGRQRVLYESVRLVADEAVRRALNETELRSKQIATLDALLKLRQVCCDPRLLLGADTPAAMEHAKLDVLFDMLAALHAQGRTVLVFSQFTALLALVHEGLALPHELLTGATPPRRRAALVARFQAGAVPVLLASLKAGGVGLNLTAADTVIHLDPWWNPAVQAQASARAHRIGQTRPVHVFQLVVQGSIEERMLALQQRKAALAASVLAQDRAAAQKFSATELRQLLAPLDDE